MESVQQQALRESREDDISSSGEGSFGSQESSSRTSDSSGPRSLERDGRPNLESQEQVSREAQEDEHGEMRQEERLLSHDEEDSDLQVMSGQESADPSRVSPSELQDHVGEDSLEEIEGGSGSGSMHNSGESRSEPLLRERERTSLHKTDSGSRVSAFTELDTASRHQHAKHHADHHQRGKRGHKADHEAASRGHPVTRPLSHHSLGAHARKGVDPKAQVRAFHRLIQRRLANNHHLRRVHHQAKHNHRDQLLPGYLQHPGTVGHLANHGHRQTSVAVQPRSFTVDHRWGAHHQHADHMHHKPV